MSGRKCTSVRTPASTMSAELVRFVAQLYSDRAELNRSDTLKQTRREMEQRNRQFDERLNNLRAESRALCEGLQHQLAETRGEALQSIADSEARLTAAIATQGKVLQGQINDLQSTALRLEEVTQCVMEAADAEAQYIRDTYLHELFCAGELEVISQRLESARGHAGQGLHAAALPLAQESLLAAQRLHAKLDAAQCLWETRRAEALSLLTAALEACSAIDEFTIPMEAEDGQIRDLEPQSTDYWTNGAWNALKDDLRVRKDQVSNDGTPPSLEFLEECAQRGNDAVQEAGALLTTAEGNLLSSIQRADLQSLFHEKLRNAGYVLIDNAWFGSDERRSNHLIMEGINGDRIAIIVRPDETPATGQTNQVEVDFQDAAPSEILRRERLEALQAALAEAYGSPALFQPLPGASWTKNAPDACFDMAAVREGVEVNVDA